LFSGSAAPSFGFIRNNSSATRARWRMGMKRYGYRLVSGGTDNHLMLVDVGSAD